MPTYDQIFADIRKKAQASSDQFIKEQTQLMQQAKKTSPTDGGGVGGNAASLQNELDNMFAETAKKQAKENTPPLTQPKQNTQQSVLQQNNDPFTAMVKKSYENANTFMQQQLAQKQQAQQNTQQPAPQQGINPIFEAIPSHTQQQAINPVMEALPSHTQSSPFSGPIQEAAVRAGYGIVNQIPFLMPMVSKLTGKTIQELTPPDAPGALSPTGQGYLTPGEANLATTVGSVIPYVGAAGEKLAVNTLEGAGNALGGLTATKTGKFLQQVLGNAYMGASMVGANELGKALITPEQFNAKQAGQNILSNAEGFGAMGAASKLAGGPVSKLLEEKLPFGNDILRPGANTSALDTAKIAGAQMANTVISHGVGGAVTGFGAGMLLNGGNPQQAVKDGAMFGMIDAALGAKGAIQGGKQGFYEFDKGKTDPSQQGYTQVNVGNMPTGVYVDKYNKPQFVEVAYRNPDGSPVYTWDLVRQKAYGEGITPYQAPPASPDLLNNTQGNTKPDVSMGNSPNPEGNSPVNPSTGGTDILDTLVKHVKTGLSPQDQQSFDTLVNTHTQNGLPYEDAVLKVVNDMQNHPEGQQIIHDSATKTVTDIQNNAPVQPLQSQVEQPIVPPQTEQPITPQSTVVPEQNINPIQTVEQGQPIANEQVPNGQQITPQQPLENQNTNVSQQPTSIQDIPVVPQQGGIPLQEQSQSNVISQQPGILQEQPLATQSVQQPQETNFNNVETGKPANLNLFHGNGASPKNIYTGVAVPIAGKGKYYALDKKTASKYGNEITNENVNLNNPLVIKTDDQWRELTQKAGWRYPNLYSLPEKEVIKNTNDLKNTVTSLGHDGLVLNFENQQGDYAKTLRNVFGHNQVVSYNPSVGSENITDNGQNGEVGQKQSNNQTDSQSTNTVKEKIVSPTKPSNSHMSNTQKQNTTDNTQGNTTERVKPAKATEAQKVVTRQEIINTIRKKLKLPVHKGRYPFGLRKALGVYKTFEQVVRTKHAEDLDTIMHEIGHHIDNLYDISNDNTFYDDLAGFAERLYGASALENKPKEYIASEGMAEFVRAWLINPERAKQLAPKLVEHLNSLLESDKQIGPTMLELQKMFQDYYSQNPEQLVMAGMSFEANRKTPKTENIGQYLTTKWEEFDAKWQDEIAPLKKVSNTAYLRAWQSRGWRGIVRNFLHGDKQGDVIYMEKNLGPSLNHILTKIAGINDIKSYENFSTYIASKRVVYLADTRGWGNDHFFTDIENAKATIAKLETPEFKKALETLVKWSNNILDIYAASGKLSSEQVKWIKAANEIYVPFRHVPMEDIGVYAGVSGGNSKFVNTAQQVKRLKGSRGTIIDPVESFLYNAFTLINESERNTTANLFADAIDQTPGLGDVVEKVPADMYGISVRPDEIIKILTEAGVPKEDIKNAIDDFNRNKQIAYFNMLAEKGKLTSEQQSQLDGLMKEQNKSDLNLDLQMALFRQQMFPTASASSEGIVMIWRDGKPMFYQIKDPLLYKAVMMMDKVTLNTWGKLLHPASKLLRMTATGTFEFAARNAWRDSLVMSLYGVGAPFEALLHGLADILGSQEWLNKWRGSGGANNSMNSLDRDYLGREKIELIARKAWSLKKLLIFPWEIAELLEEANRVGELKLRRTGKGIINFHGPQSITNSVVGSRDGTLDFLRGTANSRSVNATTAFFNAAIQGGDKFRREFFSKDTPKSKKLENLLRALTFYVLPTLLLWMAEKDNPDYQRLPQWRKDMFWNFPFKWVTGNNNDHRMFMLPIPHIEGLVFKTMPERFFNFVNTGDFNNLTQGLGTTATGIMMPNIIPTGLAILAEIKTNTDFFTERNIVPQNEQDMQPGYQYGPNTSETAKAIGSKINISPRMIEFATKAQLGTGSTAMWDLADKAGGALGMLKGAPTPSENKIPIVDSLKKAFVLDVGVASGSDNMNKFYNLLTEGKTVYNSAPRAANVIKPLGDFNNWTADEKQRWFNYYKEMPADNKWWLTLITAPDGNQKTRYTVFNSMSSKLSKERKVEKYIEMDTKMPTPLKNKILTDRQERVNADVKWFLKTYGKK